jgi:hypothetical protein
MSVEEPSRLRGLIDESKAREARSRASSNDLEARHRRSAQAEAWEDGRQDVIDYLMDRVHEEDGAADGTIGQHAVAISARRIRNPYRNGS